MCNYKKKYIYIDVKRIHILNIFRNFLFGIIWLE